MKNTYLNIFLLGVLSIVFMANRGGSPGGRSSSMSDGGATCATNGGCHAGSTPLKQDMLSTNIPANGYSPGATYEITISATDDGVNVWGFEMMAEDENGNPIGEFTNTSDVNSLSSGQRATHKFASTSSSNGQTWAASWIAPSSGSGKVIFYVSTLAANGNGNTGGDQVYNDTLQVKENLVASIGQVKDVDIDIYPNPTSHTIAIEGYTNTKAILKILDTKGQVYHSAHFTNFVDVSDLSQGTYFIRIIENKNVYIKRFVKI